MDPIADMIIQIKNAGLMKKESVIFTSSKIKLAILEVLKKAHFITSYELKGKKVIKYIEVVLAYDNDAMGKKVAKISGTKRISKTSKRVYMKSGELRPVKSGYGVMIVSTPKGIMTGSDARREKLGGEVLFTLW